MLLENMVAICAAPIRHSWMSFCVKLWLEVAEQEFPRRTSFAPFAALVTHTCFKKETNQTCMEP